MKVVEHKLERETLLTRPLHFHKLWDSPDFLSVNFLERDLDHYMSSPLSFTRLPYTPRFHDSNSISWVLCTINNGPLDFVLFSADTALL